MSSRLSATFTAAALALAASPALAAGACTDNWSVMAGEVAANKLAPVKDLQQLAAAKMPGKLIKVSLCQVSGGFQYQLVFLGYGGQLVNLTVDARDPFPQ